MTDPDIIEAAMQALLKLDETAGRDETKMDQIAEAVMDQIAEAVVAAVTPLIRADALEEAAKVADNYHKQPYPGPGTDAYWIAATIRTLKEQP